MIFTLKLLSIISGFLFPLGIIKAIRTKDENISSKYTTLACICVGIIIFTVMGLLRN